VVQKGSASTKKRGKRAKDDRMGGKKQNLGGDIKQKQPKKRLEVARHEQRNKSDLAGGSVGKEEPRLN